MSIEIKKLINEIIEIIDFNKKEKLEKVLYEQYELTKTQSKEILKRQGIPFTIRAHNQLFKMNLEYIKQELLQGNNIFNLSC